MKAEFCRPLISRKKSNNMKDNQGLGIKYHGLIITNP